MVSVSNINATVTCSKDYILKKDTVSTMLIEYNSRVFLKQMHALLNNLDQNCNQGKTQVIWKRQHPIWSGLKVCPLPCSPLHSAVQGNS